MIKIKNQIIINAFGKRIRELRNLHGISQEELANRADVPLSQIGRIERGEVNVTLSSIAAIASAFKIKIQELF